MRPDITPPPKPNEDSQPVQQSQTAEQPGEVPVQPAPPADPEVPQPEPSAEPPQSDRPGQAAPVPDKPASKKPLWITLGTAGGVLLLAVLCILGYWMFFSPASQSAMASRMFMNAAAQGNKDVLYKLTNSTSDGDKEFLSTASDQVKGSGYHQTAMKMQNGKAYFLYDLSGAKVAHARTILDKSRGHWAVTGFSYSNDDLALVPAPGSDTSSTSSSTSAASAPSPSQGTGTACLRDEDVKSIDGAAAYSTDSSDGASREYPVDDVFFKADSTDYAYPAIAPEFYDKMAAFYKNNSSKEFTIHLTGKAKDPSPTSSGVKLAHDRVGKVESELTSRGIPASRFVEEPAQQSSTYADGSERNVDVELVMKLPCAGASPSQNL